jgi:hypothetical protein
LLHFAARGEHLRAAKIGRFSERKTARGRLFLVDFSRVPAAEMIFDKESKNTAKIRNNDELIIWLWKIYNLSKNSTFKPTTAFWRFNFQFQINFENSKN